MADFDIVKAAAARNKGGRPRKIGDTTKVTLEVPGNEFGDAPAEPKMISIEAPLPPADTGTFVAPRHMDPLEEAVFRAVATTDSEPKKSRKLSERTLAEQDRGRRTLARLR